jgi:hypothetical protein
MRLPSRRHLHQARFLQRLEVRTDELDVDRHRLRCQRLDGFLALRQQFEHLQALGAGERLAHTGDLLIEKVLECPVVHDVHSNDL